MKECITKIQREQRGSRLIYKGTDNNNAQGTAGNTLIYKERGNKHAKGATGKHIDLYKRNANGTTGKHIDL